MRLTYGADYQDRLIVVDYWPSEHSDMPRLVHVSNEMMRVLEVKHLTDEDVLLVDRRFAHPDHMKSQRHPAGSEMVIMPSMPYEESVPLVAANSRTR